MKVALFTHHFLEPTHHAIALLLGRMQACSFAVFAKRFTDQLHFRLPNIAERIIYTKGPLDGMKNRGFDLVHAIYDGKTALRAARAAQHGRLPFVLSFHGGYDVHAKIWDPRYREPTLVIAERAAAITVACSSDVERLRRLGIQRCINVVRVPFDHSLVDLPRRSNSSQLVSVGRLIPKKGIDVAIRALAHLPGRELTVIGDGPDRPALDDLVRALRLGDRVRFSGLLPLSSTLEVLAGSFALLHPARVAADGNAEGTPQTLLWARGLGLPIVTTDTGSIAEVVEHEVSGILVQPDAPELLAGAVHRLDTDSSLLSRLSLRSAMEAYSVDRSAAALQAVYDQARKSCPN